MSDCRHEPPPCAICGTTDDRSLTLDAPLHRWLCGSCINTVRNQRAELGLPTTDNYVTITRTGEPS